MVLLLGSWLLVSPAWATGLPVSTGVEFYTLDGQPLIAVRITPQTGYYAYAHDGDSAKPAQVRLLDSTGKELAAKILYPQGTWRQDYFEKNKQVLVYEGPFTVFLFPSAPLAGGESPDLADVAQVQTALLLCSKSQCVPVHDSLAIRFPDDPKPLTAPQLLLELAQAKPGTPSQAALGVELPVSGTSGTSPDVAGSAPLSVLPLGTLPLVPLQNLSTATASNAPVDLSAAPANSASSGPIFTPRYVQASLEPQGLGAALLLGLLAGLILNVMPCVLPVLTIKISALMHASGNADPVERLARFREHNLLFAAGILSWFLLLAVLVGTFQMAWGGLFQNTGVVYGLLILVFVLGLSLFNVFTLPMVDFKVNASSSPRLQAYTSGLVATLLATPCSGPLLGGVLGWVALQPLPVVLMVFTATGAGMALPYLMLAAYPQGARFLPRPGAWTGIMEQLVGFFLFGTCVYLLSILPQDRLWPTVVTLFVTGFAAWLWGQWGGLRASIRQSAVVRTFAILLVGSTIWWSVQPVPVTSWQPYTEASFQAKLGKQTLLVEFTADWCPSCKALENTVMTPTFLATLVKTYNAQLIQVDLTRPNPQGEALLRALGSVSIPLTAVFPQGDQALSPLVLRDLFTRDQLLHTLDQSVTSTSGDS